MNKIFELYVLLFLFCSSIGFKNNEINRKLEEVSDKLLTNSTSIVSNIVSDISDHISNDSNDTNSISNTSDTSSKVTDSVLEEKDISSTESVSQTTIQTSILSDTTSKVTDSVFEETDISTIESESQTTISTNISSDLKTTDITSISSHNISKVTDSTVEEIESNITDSISQFSNDTYISDIISNETDSDFEEIELNITDSISQSSNETFISDMISNETDLEEIEFNKTDSNSQSLNDTYISDIISNETDSDLEEIEFNTTDSINQSSNDTFISSDNFSNVTESDLEVIDNNTDIASFGNETSIGNITESSTNTIVDNNSTETEKTDRVSSLPIDSNIIYENIHPKIILTGFGNYKKFLDYITFNLYFKRINYRNLAKFMTFHVNVNYWRRLRFLEQKEANCTKNLEEGDDTHYSCTILDIDPNKTISSISSNNDYEFNNGTHVINNEFDLIKSSFANSTSKFIDKQITDDLSNVNSFNNATLISQNSTTFIISGVSEKPINDKVIIISIDENNDGRLTNITCDINPLEDLKYEFICKPKQTIKTNLQGSMGKTPSGQNIVINISEDKDGKINDYINIDNPEKEDTFIINKNYRKSSSGISGGAIAGIVIACAAVLIAIVIICVACCRKPRKAPIQESVMKIYIQE